MVEGITTIYTQKTKVETLKLNDFKANNYLFRVTNHLILKTILCKGTQKEIWNLMTKKFQGSTRAKRNQFQVLCSKFEIHLMKSEDFICYFFTRTIVVINKIRTFGEKV